MSIKLIKTEDGYTAADTKYLKNIEIKGCSGRWKLYSNGKWLSYLAHYGNFNRLTELKAYIAEYDVNHENALRVAEEAEHKLDELREWRVSREKVYQHGYSKLPSGTRCISSKLNENDTISGGFIKWGLGKESSLGEVLFWILSSKEEAFKYGKITGSYNGHYKEPKEPVSCLIEKICHLKNDEYDDFINNFMDDGVKQKYGLGDGGSITDHECDLPYHQCMQLHKDEWRATLKNLVTVVIAPNRRSIFVNCEGYDYARYVGVALSDEVVSKYNNYLNLDEVA